METIYCLTSNRTHKEIDVSKDELQALGNFVDWPGILSSTWDVVHEGDMTIEEAKEDKLLHLAFRYLGSDAEKWLDDLEKNLPAGRTKQ